MQQAGLNNITLYENNGISITYDSLGKISNITTTGNTIELEECLNRPMFEFDCVPDNNNNLFWDYMITSILNDISLDTYNKLESLYQSIYGWIPKIELKSGDIILLNDPFFGESDELDTNETNTFELEIKPRIQTNKKPIYFS